MGGWIIRAFMVHAISLRFIEIIQMQNLQMEQLLYKVI